MVSSVSRRGGGCSRGRARLMRFSDEKKVRTSMTDAEPASGTATWSAVRGYLTTPKGLRASEEVRRPRIGLPPGRPRLGHQPRWPRVNDEVLQPRQPLGSVAYAFEAAQLEGKAAAEFRSRVIGACPGEEAVLAGCEALHKKIPPE